MRGELPAAQAREIPEPDVKRIREQIGFSQAKFATLIGVSIRTIQNWEQGHRRPTGAAKVLLRLAQADPEAIFKNLSAAGKLEWQLITDIHLSLWACIATKLAPS